MELPDDCKYIDYSIMDVKKAYKKIEHYPLYIRDKVIDELEKINKELACHLRDHFSEQ